MRIVLDTNILVSALISKGTPPYALYQAWQAGKFSLVTSSLQIAEARRVLGYDKLKKFITPSEAKALLANIEADSVIVTPAEGVEFSRDPDDNVIIATAIAGKVDYIVTGDKRDLLSLKAVKSIQIITASKAATLF